MGHATKCAMTAIMFKKMFSDRATDMSDREDKLTLVGIVFAGAVCVGNALGCAPLLRTVPPTSQLVKVLAFLLSWMSAIVEVVRPERWRTGDSKRNECAAVIHLFWFLTLREGFLCSLLQEDTFFLFAFIFLSLTFCINRPAEKAQRLDSGWSNAFPRTLDYFVKVSISCAFVYIYFFKLLEHVLWSWRAR